MVVLLRVLCNIQLPCSSTVHPLLAYFDQGIYLAKIIFQLIIDINKAGK